MIGVFLKKHVKLFLFVFIVDRITKHLILTRCTTKCVVNQLLSFELTFNRGISWGMFHSENEIIFWLINCIIILIIIGLACYTFVRFMNHELIIGEILILAGSFSNLLDRFIYDGVIDFILFSYNDWSFPVFNVADVCIIGGVGLILLEYYKTK